jgi:hypothetical protein
MPSIIGEKWNNADASSSLASINEAIESTTLALNKATALYTQASDALTACYGLSQSACLQKTGGYAHSTWSPQYENNKALIEKYKKELTDLLALQKQIGGTQLKNAEAENALADADSATTGANTKKWLLYGGIGLGVIALIIFGVMWIKKMKK